MNVNTLTALAESNRFNIIGLLRGGPLPVGHIARRLHLDQPQASKHLKVLKDAKLVEVEPQAQRRYYRLRPQAFAELEDWFESYQQAAEARMDRLDKYLNKDRRGGRRGHER
jgi:DNA-binding transcriptional ArsR family regulator